MSPVAIRALDRSEWAMFRDFRLAALKAAPGAFATGYEEASRRTPEQWQATVSGDGHQVFGLFDNQRLVGISGVFAGTDDPRRESAVFVMSFILPEYRRRRLSHLLYRARLDWVLARPRFKRIETAVRASNAVSLGACRRFGFVPIGRAPRTWPDGTTEDEILCEMRLGA